MGAMSQEEINKDLFDEVIRLKNKVRGLEDSLKIYKDDNDRYETSTHIDEFLYEFSVNEKGEIPCLIKVHGIEHSFGITKKDASRFLHLFQMKAMEKHK